MTMETKMQNPGSQAPSGLTSADAAQRLIQYGPNSVASKKHMRPVAAFFSKFNSPLLWIIIVAAFISYFTGERINAVILVVMITLSVVLDFVNTYRSEKAVNSLVARVVTTATVRRDGQERQILLHDIVPGDVVILKAGDIIPADGRIVEEKDLYVNQSALTGESVPAAKDAKPFDAADRDLSLERIDTVFMGTSVVSGYATMAVLLTGHQTEFGKVASRLAGAEPPTDFEKSIRQFSVFLMWLTLVMTAFVFGVNIFFHDRSFLDSLIFAIAIAIGLTPELLPVIITVSLSRGAVRMAKKEVIVKRLPAIQNLGRMDVLCTDKTGTLTENKIAVVKYVDGFGAASEDVLHSAFLNSAFHTGVPNPLDTAIRTYKTFDLAAVKKVDEIPFDFERRRESIIVETAAARTMITKGSPESVYQICTSYRAAGRVQAMSPEVMEAARQQYQWLSADGFKVLGVAEKDVDRTVAAYEPADETGMVFLGYVALLDPPKATARAAIDDLERLGVEVKILTGDSPVLTEKICREIDVPTKGTITGDELRKLPPGSWPTAVNGHTIFARIDPEQKEEIINALRAARRVVGFMGDGINDAPALKAADVGVSVDNAVDVAKETADIILLRTDLHVLRDGVLEGRRTFQNTLKYILMGLSSNFGNMFSMMAASAFLPFLPMLPVQIILNNFIYDTSQLSLSTDSVDDADIVKPTIWDIRFIRRFMVVFGPISSIFDFATFGLLWLGFHYTNAPFQTGWFIESIATQVFVIYMIRTRKIPFIQSRPSRWLFINTFGAVTLAWILPFIPFAQRIFGLVPLPPLILLLIAGFVVVYLFLVEGVKRWFYRRSMSVAVR